MPVSKEQKKRRRERRYQVESQYPNHEGGKARGQASPSSAQDTSRGQPRRLQTPAHPMPTSGTINSCLDITVLFDEINIIVDT